MLEAIKSALKLLNYFFDPAERNRDRKNKLIAQIAKLRRKKLEAIKKDDSDALSRISYKLEWLREQKRLLNK